MSERETWQSIAQRKRAERNALIPEGWKIPLPSNDIINVIDIPRTCGLLSAHELDITEKYDATALGEAIANKRLTCVEVTMAFCKRAAIAQQLTNCLTEILFESALKRAAYLDIHLSRHSTPIGPLHGIPISLKDSFRVSTYDSSIGIAALAYKPSTSTSPLVSLLLSAGAVIYCKTNVPQTLMALDSDNNIFGRTLNPLNRHITAGGSSGGEGALIAMRGSVLGVGTDIGGSIRIPAYCQGLFGFKSSANRVPYANQESGALAGVAKLGVESTAGPIATSLRDCKLFLSTVAAAKPWLRDPHVIPGLWDHMDLGFSVTDSTFSAAKPLTIGILTSDLVTTPLPPIAKLLGEVGDALSSAGHRIISITPPTSIKAAQSLVNAFFGLDGGNTMLDLLASHSEPLTSWLEGRLKRKSPMTIAQAAALHAKREALMTEMLSLWQTPAGEEVDAIVCPIAPHPVPPLDRWNAVGYTSMWVLLDYPAGTVPIRQFTEEDLKGECSHTVPLSSWDAANRTLWDPAKVDRQVYLGSPLCVQVVAPRLQEKRLYRAMEAVDQAVHAPSHSSNEESKRVRPSQREAKL